VAKGKLTKEQLQKEAARSNPPTIIDLDDLQDPINILCHGDTGAGKNRLWGHLPRMFVIAIEAGSTSMKSAGIKGAKVARCHSWPDIVGAFEYLRDHVDEFDWVMIDSITKAQSLCIRHIMKMVVLANPDRDPHIPAQGDHFKWQLTIKQFVEDFNDLDVNTIWLSRSMVREDPDGEDIIVPSIEGKDYGMSAWVCGEMSLLCYLKKVRVGKGDEAKTVRRLYTNEHPTYWCKDWYDALPHIIEFDNDKGVAQKIIDLIQASGNSPSEAKAKKTPAKKRSK
jgi:hypothetical protein